MRLPRVRLTVRWIMVGVAVMNLAVTGMAVVICRTVTRPKLALADEFPLLAVKQTVSLRTDEVPVLADKSMESSGPDELRSFCSKTLDEWISDLRNKSSSERSEAAWALAYIGPRARASVPDLVEIIRIDRDDRLQFDAVEALGRIGPDAAPAVPLLIKRLRKQGCYLGVGGVIIERVEGNPKFALARIGAPAVPALIDVLNGSDEVMRPCAAEILAMIGRPSKAAVPALTRSLREGNILQSYSARALGQIGPDATQAVPALYSVVCLKGEDSLFRGLSRYESWEVVNAMARIGALPIPKLVERLSQRGFNSGRV